MSYTIHPAAELFPLMSDDELAGLIQDIRENGQREAATFWNGQLIDGRNRATACERLNIDLDACELDPETDPIKWVLSHNLYRRHLTPSQKSQVALKLKKLLEPEAKERQQAGLKRGDQKPVVEKLPPREKSRDRAASMLGISGKLVDAAETVDEQGDDDLKQAVTSGKVSVTKAAKVAKTVAPGKQLEEATKKAPKRKAEPGEAVDEPPPSRPQPFRWDLFACIHDFRVPLTKWLCSDGVDLKALLEVIEDLHAAVEGRINDVA